MANTKLCPNCNGKLVPVGERTGGFSSGKAVAGAVIAGPVGVAAGALGKKLVTLLCEKCGYTVEMTEKDALAAKQYGTTFAPIVEIQRDIDQLLVNARFSERVMQKIEEYKSQGCIHVPYVELSPVNDTTASKYLIAMGINKPIVPEEWKNKENYKKYQELDLAVQEALADMRMEEMRQRAWDNFQSVFQAACTEDDKEISNMLKEENIQKEIDALKDLAAKDRASVGAKYIGNNEFLAELRRESLEKWASIQDKNVDEIRQNVLENLGKIEVEMYSKRESQASFFNKVLSCLSYEPVTENLIVHMAQLPISDIGLKVCIDNVMGAFGDAIQTTDVCCVMIINDLKAQGLPAEQARKLTGFCLAGGPAEKQRIQESRRAEAERIEAERLAEERHRQCLQWESQGLCSFCGGTLKKSLFGKRCEACGKKN